MEQLGKEHGHPEPSAEHIAKFEAAAKELGLSPVSVRTTSTTVFYSAFAGTVGGGSVR